MDVGLPRGSSAAAFLDTGDLLDAPILMTGRGGSGTRLLAEMARSVGVFLGNELNESSDTLESEDPVKELVIEKLSSGTPLGPASLARWRTILRAVAAGMLDRGAWRSPRPWGWKLPELMFVLPEVFEAFPGGRLIHLVRHPVDMSLRRTHLTSRMDNPVGRVALPVAYRSVGLDPALIPRHRRYMRNAVAWQYQVATVLDWARTYLAPDRYLELRFEDLCGDPALAQRRVADFVAGSVEAPAPAVDASRIRNYEPEDPRAGEVWTVCGETAARLGYQRPNHSGPHHTAPDHPRPGRQDQRP